MAVGFVAGASTNFSSSSAPTVAASGSGGHGVVSVATASGATVTSVTDTSGRTWVRNDGVTWGGGREVESWRTTDGQPTGTITVNLSASDSGVIAYDQVTGGDGTIGTTNTNTGESATPDCGSVTIPTDGGTHWVAVCSGGGVTITAGSGSTILSTGTQNPLRELGTGYTLTDSTPTAGSANNTWGMVGVPFNAASSGGGTESETDGVDMGDSATASVSHARSAADGLDIGDSVARSVAYSKSVSDGFNLGDTGQVSGQAGVTDGFDVGDSVIGARSFDGAVTDGFILGEDITTKLSVDSGPDGVTLGDSVSFTTTAPVGVTDGFTVGDVVVYGLVGLVTDGVSLGDSAVASLASSSRSVTNGLRLGDVVDAAGQSARAVTDGVQVGDNVTGLPGYPVSVTDGAIVGDAVSFVFSSVGERSVLDGFVFGDSVAVLGGFPVSVSDRWLMGDSVIGVGSAQLQVVPRDMKPGTGRANILGD